LFGSLSDISVTSRFALFEKFDRFLEAGMIAIAPSFCGLG
jgi:hypothetical protein